MERRVFGRAALVVGVVGVVMSSAATALAAGPLVRVSQPGVPGSPYASCPAPSPGGVLYDNAEVEPSVAINPANPSNLVGAYQQDRWSNGGAHGLVAASSVDGGSTWNRSPLPFSRCAPGGLPYNQASDPWVSIGPDGTVYATAVSFDNNTAPPLGVGATSVSAATSSDGGAHWSNVKTVFGNANGNQYGLMDKEAVTADPVKAGTAYLVWDRLFFNSAGTAFHGESFFSMTTDAGRTWSAARRIVVPGPGQSTLGNQILVDPRSGTLYDFFAYINGKLPNAIIEFVKSQDGGATWGAPQVVQTLQSGVGVLDPNSGVYIRTGEDAFPAVTINPANGALYAMWEDNRFSGGAYDEVALSSSTDGGAHWTAPDRVNTPTGRAAFTPSIAIGTGGTIAVTYYDFRDVRAGQSVLPTNLWSKVSTDGGKTFGPDQHLAGPFNELAAPNAGGPFIGDYQGLVATGTGFDSFFVQTNCDRTCNANRTDVYFRSF